MFKPQGLVDGEMFFIFIEIERDVGKLSHRSPHEPVMKMGRLGRGWREWWWCVYGGRRLIDYAGTALVGWKV
jgi:hypothetical protein